MLQTNFSQNYNGKLFLDHFGDVRLYHGEKYVTGNVIEILYRTRQMGISKVVAVADFKYGQIRDSFSFINCAHHAAYQADMLQRFYGRTTPLNAETRLQHVVFEWTERNMEMHREMLKDWWDNKVAQQPFITESQNPIA